MGRKGRRNRRRSHAIFENALRGNSNLPPELIQQARRQSRHANRAIERRKQLENAVAHAQKSADQVTELFIGGIPLQCTALEIVTAVLSVLRNSKTVSEDQVKLLQDYTAKSQQCPVLRCEISKREKVAHAFIAFRDEQYANVVLRARCFTVYIKAIKSIYGLIPQVSRRVAVPGVGSAWRTSLDPGCRRWKVGTVQVGEKVAHDDFCYFWASTPFFDLSENSFVELNPVLSVLAITLGRKQNMLKAKKYQSYKGGEEGFESVESMLKIEIPFRVICDRVRAEENRGGKEKYAVYFPIAKAPHLYRAVGGGRANGGLTWDCQGGLAEEMRWVRTVDFTKNQAFARARGIRIMLGEKELKGFFAAMYHQYQAEKVYPEPSVAKAFEEKGVLWKSDMFAEVKEKFGLTFRVRYMVDCILSLGTICMSSLSNRFWEILGGMEEHEAMSVLDGMFGFVSANEYYTRVNDPVKILEECCENFAFNDAGDDFDQDTTQNGYFTEDNYSMEVESDSGDSVLTDDTEEFVIEQFKRQLRLDDDLDEVQPQPQQQQQQQQQPPRPKEPSSRHYTYIRRLLFTPTRTLAMKPEADLLNRILRQYSAYQDRFVRVSFCDESGGSLGFASSEDLYTRVRKALRDGVYVAGEKFMFLAFSNSQLRDHAAWFFNQAPDGLREPLTAADIRAWMGNFNAIRVPGKYAARLGQAFSSTVGTYGLQVENEVHFPDLYDTQGKYAFSDGVGVISQSLADDVAKKLRIKWHRPTPSAFQIRYGGAKGMLTVWKKVLPPGGDIHVGFRPSMVKFDCRHKTLEVVGFSKRLPLFLNRQIIMLLSNMGVPDRPFEDKQRRFLTQLDQAMQSDGAQDALDLLLSTGLFESDQKLRTSAPAMNATAFFRAGLTCASCEHLFNIMYAFRRRVLQDLSDKARIPVDSDKGFCAIGVMDEIGVLREDEIFCQYTDPTSNSTKVVRGRVIVGRSPCLHPGDIQPVRAVDYPALRHLVDVIVFPQRGNRPIPSMLSGGDLDGDIFFCLFDPDIIPEMPKRESPMDYTPQPPTKLDREITTSDVADFFVEYIRNDNLGKIANAHLVHADKERAGVRSPNCLKLAKLHSIAVDFAKTSTPANLPRELQLKNQANEYPDFMGKHKKVSYKSNKVLGKLYRACIASDSGKEGSKFVPNPNSKRIDDIIDRFPASQESLDQAKRICTVYNVNLRRLMNQYGVGTEGEVLSGQVLSFSIRHAQFLDKRKHFDVTMRMNRQANELRREARTEFFKGLGQRPHGVYTVETIRKACAWYKACLLCAEEDRARGEAVLMSFPWVVADILLPVIRDELKSSWEGGLQ